VETVKQCYWYNLNVLWKFICGQPHMLPLSSGKEVGGRTVGGSTLLCNTVSYP
jgi:hypothetical protein